MTTSDNKEAVLGTPTLPAEVSLRATMVRSALSVHCVAIISLRIATILECRENLQKVWNTIAPKHPLLLVSIWYDVVAPP
jgi:hypothetical protein